MRADRAAVRARSQCSLTWILSMQQREQDSPTLFLSGKATTRSMAWSSDALQLKGKQKGPLSTIACTLSRSSCPFSSPFMWSFPLLHSLGLGDGQGGLVCWGSWGHKEFDTTEWLNWTELNYIKVLAFTFVKTTYKKPSFQKLLPENHCRVDTSSKRLERSTMVVTGTSPGSLAPSPSSWTPSQAHTSALNLLTKPLQPVSGKAETKCKERK